jgi:hypothetical protein
MEFKGIEISWPQIMTAIAGIIGWFQAKKATWDYIAKISQPLVSQAEQMMLDGKIDRSERKLLVMALIKQLEADGKIKLNPITRFIVGKVVDRIAAKLPDITVSQDVKADMEKMVNELKGGKK